MKVLVTGGAGYIGSITASALERAGHTPIVLDSLVSGPRPFVKGRIFYEGDVADRELVGRIVREHPDLTCTIHMAARTVVPESVRHPYTYYQNNVTASLELFDQLSRLDKPRVLFSSSASIYATPPHFEVDEHSPIQPTSPYARTKCMVELMLQDLAEAGHINAIALRYFNPIGSDPDNNFGIHVREPSHVLGQLLLAASGRRAPFVLTGTTHPTRDGTGIRDYVHVWDVARAHVAAVEEFDRVLCAENARWSVFNVGTGRGTTVRELISAFEAVSGRTVRVEEGPPRQGDSVGAFANVEKARRLLGWSSELTVEEAIASALAWDAKRSAVLGYR